MRAALDAAGLNLYSAIRLESLPGELASEVARVAEAGHGTVVLVGNHGAKLWPFLTPRLEASPDPVDDYSREVVARVIDRHLDGHRGRILYPGDAVLPLQRLGAACGWGDRSWLGINVDRRFGSWYAFRVVFLTACELPERLLPAAPSPCASCAGRPCVSACPVGAPRAPGEFDLAACVEHRLQPGSGCAYRCKARNACPVGHADRYPQPMIRYFYARSLASLARGRVSPL